jgi:hypothetical protein
MNNIFLVAFHTRHQDKNQFHRKTRKGLKK